MGCLHLDTKKIHLGNMSLISHTNKEILDSMPNVEKGIGVVSPQGLPEFLPTAKKGNPNEILHCIMPGS